MTSLDRGFGHHDGTGSRSAPTNDFEFDAAPDHVPQRQERQVRQAHSRSADAFIAHTTRTRARRRPRRRGLGAFSMIMMSGLIAGCGFFLGAGVQSVMHTISPPKVVGPVAPKPVTSDFKF